MKARRGPRPIVPDDPATRRRRTREQCDIDTNLMAARYVNDQRSIQQIADEFGVSYGTVHKALVDANVQRRSRGGNHRLSHAGQTGTT